MAKQGVQVLGLLRFSYPSVYNGRGAGDQFEPYRQSLYEPQRLERRLFWYQHVVLPTLRQQTDPDFKAVLLAGDRLPEPYRSRLLEMVAAVPQIAVELQPEGQNHRETVKELMEKHSDPDAEAVAEFQLDDDDGVADRFVALTRERYEIARPMLEASRKVTLDFTRGMMLRTSPRGVDIKPVLAQFWTPGLITFRRPQDRTVLRNVSHLLLWQHMPCLSYVTPIMFVRGVHEDNVSNISNRWDRLTGFDFDEGRIPVLFERTFGIDLDAMRRDHARLREAEESGA